MFRKCSPGQLFRVEAIITFLRAVATLRQSSFKGLRLMRVTKTRHISRINAIGFGLLHDFAAFMGRHNGSPKPVGGRHELYTNHSCLNPLKLCHASQLHSTTNSGTVLGVRQLRLVSVHPIETTLSGSTGVVFGAQGTGPTERIDGGENLFVVQ